jgi:hypothetical protein
MCATFLPKHNVHLPLCVFLLIPFNCRTKPGKKLPEPDTKKKLMIVINERDETEGRLKAIHNYIL